MSAGSTHDAGIDGRCAETKHNRHPYAEDMVRAVTWPLQTCSTAQTLMLITRIGHTAVRSLAVSAMLTSPVPFGCRYIAGLEAKIDWLQRSLEAVASGNLPASCSEVHMQHHGEVAGQKPWTCSAADAELHEVIQTVNATWVSMVCRLFNC